MRIAKLFGAVALALGIRASAAPATDMPSPYRDEARDFIYNLLFCDRPELFTQGKPPPPGSDMALVLAEDTAPAAIRRIADDPGIGSRTRMLAYNWLRRHGEAVTPKILLGVIVEVPLDGGLDTIAVFADGTARYINQSGRIAVFEDVPDAMKPTVEALLAAAKPAIEAIAPVSAPRPPPPPRGDVRLSFLASDGVYVREGAFGTVQNDPMTSPIMIQAETLLIEIVNAK